MTISSSTENLITSIVINLDELAAENNKLGNSNALYGHLTNNYLENSQWNQNKSVWIFKLKKKKNPKNNSFLVLQMSAITK